MWHHICTDCPNGMPTHKFLFTFAKCHIFEIFLLQALPDIYWGSLLNQFCCCGIHPDDVNFTLFKPSVGRIKNFGSSPYLQCFLLGSLLQSFDQAMSNFITKYAKTFGHRLAKELLILRKNIKELNICYLKLWVMVQIAHFDFNTHLITDMIWLLEVLCLGCRRLFALHLQKNVLIFLHWERFTQIWLDIAFTETKKFFFT